MRTADITSYAHPNYAFGIDRKKVAAEMRRMADDIEAGAKGAVGGGRGLYISFQGVTIIDEISNCDYSFTTYSFKFATNKQENSVRKDKGKIYTAGEKFPDDVAKQPEE
jgi:hypothetical protein